MAGALSPVIPSADRRDAARPTEEITSTIRGVPSEVALRPEDGMKQPCAVNLHNVVTVSKEHLGRRLCQLDPRRMREVCDALGFALGCGS